MTSLALALLLLALAGYWYARTSDTPFRSKPPEPVAAPCVDDPTFGIRRKQANLCEAVMQRVVELEDEAKRLTEIANKLRAAVVANT